MINRQKIQMDEAAWAGIMNRFTLALFKGAVGWLGGSRVLLSDALFSAGEAIHMLAGSKTGKASAPPLKTSVPAKPAKDKQAENGFLLIAVLCLILVWGAAQAIAVSVKVLLEGDPPAPHYAAGMAAVLSIGINEILFQLRLKKAAHTEQRKRLVVQHKLSLLSSIIVLTGIIGSMTGDMLDNDVLLKFDPIAAILVSVVVLWNTARMLMQGINVAGDRKTVYDSQQMLETIHRVYGVITVEKFHMAEQGGRLAVYVQISVNPRTSMHEAVEIAGRAKVLLLTRFSYIQEAEVHVMPYEPGYPYKSNYENKDNDETLLQ